MLTENSKLIEQTIIKLLMVENLFSVISHRCWENDSDYPTETVDKKTLELFRERLNKANTKLMEIEMAGTCV